MLRRNTSELACKVKEIAKFIRWEHGLSFLSEQSEKYLATAAEMLAAEGVSEAAEILRLSTAKVEVTGCDNWNGGTKMWTIYLLVEPVSYVKLGNKRVLKASENRMSGKDSADIF